jgi:hypothetical protein
MSSEGAAVNTASKAVIYVCPVHGEHEAVMYVNAKKTDESYADGAAFCMFCLIEKLEGLGVHRMQIKTKQ